MSIISRLFRPQKIYLDHAAATPVLPEVKREMERYWSRDFYNPNSIYTEAVKVRDEVEGYRGEIAKMLGVAKDAMIFTSGGTEANVLAVSGVRPGKVITEGEVHPSITEAIHSTNSSEVVLVSSQTTDNKLGRTIRIERKRKNSEYPLLHIDASQTAAYFDVGLEKLQCDLLTLDAAKIGGPKGIGALVVRKGVKIDISPRGTLAVPLIAGFAKALELAVRDREVERERLSTLGQRFADTIRKELPQAEVKTPLPHMVEVSVPPLLPELVVLALDRAGVQASTGPACNANKPEPPETPVRFSFGRAITEKDLSKAAEIFCQVAKNLLKSSHATLQPLHDQGQGRDQEGS